MTSSFVAYIDESGDEGFTFLPDGRGSSHWFVQTAVVYRRPHDLSAVAALKAARATLGWEAKKAFHFCDMRHEQRLVMLNEVIKTPFRTVSILSYKPDIPDPERFQANKWMLYHYLTRLLIERVSWLCRDHMRPGEGDGTVDLIFSDRAAMSYEDIRVYINRLRAQAGMGTQVNIHWPAINMDSLRAVAHAQLAGLQVADAVATSTHYGVKLSRFGIADPSYLALLRRHAYRHRDNFRGYGIKTLTGFEQLQDRMPHLRAAFLNW
ncbi:hypothetical protein CS062_02250 [Roseateles chitinivorans]|uniref:DUF3800 domain-containing protein n=1 Tax=Roseateles chitinivorans TaxID=2917965 RepID=A0A2G9CEI4_9BURK|nr:DUF3800 domain-containing protein [Roseateles chitinivorans]PIM54732.1 hypothetical protein CS062_02250 [Roseateles chitinivorans]